MPPITIKKFLGYNTKPDKLLNNPAIGSNCENIIINDGDLCNMPYAKRFMDLTFNSPHKHLAIFYTLKEFDLLVLLASHAMPPSNLIIGDIDGLGSILAVPINIEKFSGFDFKYGTTLHSEYAHVPTDGNFVKVGDWIFLLGQYSIFNIDKKNSLNTIIPKMPKIRFFQITISGNPVNSAILSIIGLSPPVKISETATDTKVSEFSYDWPTSTWDIAITFITDIHNGNTFSDRRLSTDTTGTTWFTKTSLDDIESNATILGVTRTWNVTDQVPLIRVYLPLNFNLEFALRSLKLGVYVKRSDQTEHTFIGYTTNISAATIKDDDEQFFEGKLISNAYVDIVLDIPDPNNVQDLNRVIPITGDAGPIPGAHDAPLPALHGAFYNQRMYYLSIVPDRIHEEAEGRVFQSPSNRVQISNLTPDGEDETGRYANYIAREEFVGNSNEGLTGCIEFLSQLIIFKESSTWVFTSDLITGGGSIRLLFKDAIGGIGKFGGHAYATHNDVLYWGNFNGIYAYSGDNRPVRISDAIQEDLNKLVKFDRSRYQYMRMSFDHRYGLLYITFPVGAKSTDITDWPSFIFHTEEGGAWTRVSKSQAILSVVTDSKNRVYFSRRQRLEELGFLEDTGINERRAFWQSSMITMGQQQNDKHWQYAKVFISEDLASQISLGVSLSDGQGKLKAFDILSPRKILKIGRYSKGLIFGIFPVNNLTSQPFRINGFEIQAHVKGRR